MVYGHRNSVRHVDVDELAGFLAEADLILRNLRTSVTRQNELLDSHVQRLRAALELVEDVGVQEGLVQFCQVVRDIDRCQVQDDLLLLHF